MMAEPLLSVTDLSVEFPARRGRADRKDDVVRAVDGVSFEIPPGTTLGLVGESGSGKTTVARAILGLTKVTSGYIRFDGWELAGGDRRSSRSWNAGAVRRRRRGMQAVFQDAGGSLNPRMRIGSIVAEPLEIHGLGTRRERSTLAAEWLERVGLRAADAKRYPHELSGGQRQRVGIARAIVLHPRFLVLDEPVSALDVSIQAQILHLLADLRRAHGLTYLFIAHNLAVVRKFCDRVAVMHRGRIVETGETHELFSRPEQAYTKALLAAVPKLGVRG